MCAACAKSYDRYAEQDGGSIWDVAVWAARRARRALRARLKRGNEREALIVDGLKPAKIGDLALVPARGFTVKESFVDLGQIARERLGMQAQYAVRYVRGSHGSAELGGGLRFRGDPADYHFVQIHKDDVEEFVRRVIEHRRSTGQIR